MALTFHTTNFRNAVLSALLTAAGTNTNPAMGACYIFPTTTARPADPSVAATGQLVGASTNMTNMLQASNGVSVMHTATSQMPIASGTASWFRLYNNAATQLPLIDGTVGLAGSGADMILSTLNAVAGVALNITAFSLGMPASLGTIQLNQALRNALVNIWTVAAANIGLGSGGTLTLYSGTPPASADVQPTGTVLAQFALGTAPWGTPANGSAILAAPLVVNAAVSGTVGYARLTKGSYCLQGTAGTTGKDFTTDTDVLVAGSPVQVVGATIAV